MVDRKTNKPSILTTVEKVECGNDDVLATRNPTRLSYINYSQNRCYFLTICTKDKKCILSEIVDGRTPYKSASAMSRDVFMPEVRLTEVGRIVDKYILSINKVDGVFVDKYVIMPNHIHIILVVKNKDPLVNTEKEDGNISLAVKKANATIPHIVSTFKRFCNRELGEDIFQRSYYDHVIRNIDDYNETVKYILHNPRRWFLKYKIPKR